MGDVIKLGGAESGTVRQSVAGLIVLPGREKGLRCTVSELTSQGAKVTAQNVALPNNFVLRIADVPSDRPCEVMCRDQFTVGVRFLKQATAFEVYSAR